MLIFIYHKHINHSLNCSGDIAKELGRKWSDVDAEHKSRYEAMADKDKQRYERVSC